MADCHTASDENENGEVVRFGKAVSLSGRLVSPAISETSRSGCVTLCMSAPEELFYSQTEAELNPFAGIVKLALLGLGIAILLLVNPQASLGHCRPFAMLMGGGRYLLDGFRSGGAAGKELSQQLWRDFGFSPHFVLLRTI